MAEFPIYKPNIVRLWRPRTTLGFPRVNGAAGTVVRAPNWLGDTLMAMPAVYRLRAMAPDDEEISVVCPSALRPVWEAAAWIDNVIAMDERRLDGSAAAAIREKQPSLGVVLPNSFGSAWDVRKCGVPVRIGRAGRLRRLLLTHCAPRWRPAYRYDDFHQLSHYLEVISLVGEVDASAGMPALTPSVSEERLAYLMPQETRNRALVIAPGAAFGPAKQWPVEYFHEVARRWSATGGKVYVVGTAKDHELGEGVLCGLFDGVNLCGKTDLADLMGVLKQAKCCIANDSGAMHLAAALGPDGIALFGSTNPAATGPLGRGKWVVMYGHADCSPCFSRTCPGCGETPYTCLKSLRPGMVHDALSSLLELGAS